MAEHEISNGRCEWGKGWSKRIEQRDRERKA